MKNDSIPVSDQRRHAPNAGLRFADLGEEPQSGPAWSTAENAFLAKWLYRLRATPAVLVDQMMCAMMYSIQRKHRLHSGSQDLLEEYLQRSASLSRQEFYAAGELLAKEALADLPSPRVCWSSPVETPYAENNTARVDVYPCAAGWKAPTVIMLHALMSRDDKGYRQWAATFNARGWNACFVHLPFHYSRTPAGRRTGELAITADVVRTAEGLRQGVVELRQLMALLRELGCHEFGIWATSYGAWIGALLASVEPDFRFVALMEPIVNIEHAIWTSPTGLAIRRQMEEWRIRPEMLARHFPLCSPFHAQPLCGGSRILMTGGTYDRISRVEDLRKLQLKWAGAELIEVKQGHFGFQMMPAVWERLISRGTV